MIGTRIILAALAAFVTGPALACSPVPLEAGTRVQDGVCGVYYNDDAYTARGVSDATDLGGGFVEQYYFSGNACYGQTSMIVSDCAAGRAVVFGPGPVAGPMTETSASDPWLVLESRVHADAAKATPMPLADILASTSGRFINAAMVTIPGRVGISNDEAAPKHYFNLGCGCRAFYPGSAGAGS